MKHMYIVFRCTKGFDWERQDSECVTSDRRVAEKIVEYFKENEIPDGDDYRYYFWYEILPVMDTYESFIKDYIETNSED